MFSVSRGPTGRVRRQRFWTPVCVREVSGSAGIPPRICRATTSGSPSTDGRSTDAELIAAFEAIEERRHGTPLTYFEFGTLAALQIFQRRGVDAAVLEVGLGGRLDAVNLVDADVAVVTSIALDHAQWLGSSRAEIARERRAYSCRRAGRVWEARPPRTLIEAARTSGARLLRRGKDFAGRL